jgi:uncharacterized membrane protein YedE/YeeE
MGGLLIGLAAALLLVANGRVAGISGILGQFLWPDEGGQRSWRLAFLVGLPIGAGIVVFFDGPLVTQVDATPPRLVLAGILVGFGTRLGNGCTSGHGVCGISRGSGRSLTATVIFMTIAGIVVFITRHAT